MYSHFSKVPQFPVIYKLVTLKEFQQETAGVGSLIYVTSTGYFYVVTGTKAMYGRGKPTQVSLSFLPNPRFS